MAGVSLYEIAKLYAHLQPEHLHNQVARIPQISIESHPKV
jgi:hypothetical protein